MRQGVAGGKQLLAFTAYLYEVSFMPGMHMPAFVLEQADSDQNRHRRYDDAPSNQRDIQCCHSVRG